jgi:hypothetical protein
MRPVSQRAPGRNGRPPRWIQFIRRLTILLQMGALLKDELCRAETV